MNSPYNANVSYQIQLTIFRITIHFINTNSVFIGQAVHRVLQQEVIYSRKLYSQLDSIS